MRTRKRAKRTWDVVTNCFENFLVDLSRSNFLKKRITDREKLAEYTQIFVKKVDRENTQIISLHQ